MRDDLTSDETSRYSRHLLLPQVGVDGQLRLKSARVLLVGAGGLGAPLGLYLSAAGVGTIGLVDNDVVDESNLQRQVAYLTDDVGLAKTTALKRRLTALNPLVNVVEHKVRLSADNVRDIFDPYDIVVDGTDNFPTRYLVNDACVLIGKPNVYGSIYRFEGQASVFATASGPCYRCIYPEPPPPDTIPNCEDGGVLGVLPGIIGTIQATETIKLILGQGDTLVGRLLLFDALRMRFREVALPRNRHCPVCGDNPVITELTAAGGECSVSEAVPEISAKDLQARMRSNTAPIVLDVRERHEYAIANIGGTPIPLAELPGRFEDLDRERDIVVHCRSGLRSAYAVRLLQQAGFERVWNLRGGILAWSDEVDGSVRKY